MCLFLSMFITHTHTHSFCCNTHTNLPPFSFSSTLSKTTCKKRPVSNSSDYSADTYIQTLLQCSTALQWTLVNSFSEMFAVHKTSPYISPFCIFCDGSCKEGKTPWRENGSWKVRVWIPVQLKLFSLKRVLEWSSCWEIRTIFVWVV